MEKYGYIYCTTDLKNGMKYIGQKKSPVFIQKYKGSGAIIKSKLISRPSDFKVDLIEWCYSKDELNKCEKDWTDAVGLFPLSYNLISGGGQPGFSDEIRKRLSEVQKGNQNGKGWVPTEEQIKKMSESHKGKSGYWKGKKLSLTAIMKIRETIKLRDNHWYTNGKEEYLTNECPEGFYRGRLKYTHTEEAKRKISEANKKRILNK